jgi:hypothetical protein
MKLGGCQGHVSEGELIGQHRSEVRQGGRITVTDLAGLLSLTDQVGHQSHCLRVATIDVIGEGIEDREGHGVVTMDLPSEDGSASFDA